MTIPNLSRSDHSRVWTIEDTAGPANVPVYQGLFKAGSLTWPQGDVELIKVPSSVEYGKFDVADKIPGEQGAPGLTLTARYTMDQSDLLRILRRRCDMDVQVHLGKCKNPQDFNAGWDKIIVLERALPTDYGIPELGALGPDERAVVNEEVPVTGEDMYEIMPIIISEQGASQIVQEVIDIEVCDAISCGACGIPSDGCEKVFALTLSAGGSPGLSAEVAYSEDSGATYADTNITTLAANEDPNDMACVGTLLVVVSNDSNSLHYATSADILTASETWTEVTTGFVGGGEPNRIFSLSPRHTWIVGDGGYVYFTDDPTSSVSVQSAGVATTEDLKGIHGYNTLNLVAVGENNAVILTRNGGTTWAAVTGPDVGVELTTVWMRSQDEWIVGTIQGRLWYTRDAGVTWTEKPFPGSGAGVVRDIRFSTPTVGWLSHDTAGPAGRILRTIDGGYTWYVAPESNADIPANDRINKMAVCASNPNVVYGGGLADDGTDGIIVKGS